MKKKKHRRFYLATIFLGNRIRLGWIFVALFLYPDIREPPPSPFQKTGFERRKAMKLKNKINFLKKFLAIGRELSYCAVKMVCERRCKPV